MTEHILDSKSSSKIATMIIALGTDLDLSGVLLGIETQAQAQRVAALGATAIKGDWVSPARPPSDVPTFLSNWSHEQITSSAIAPIPNRSYLRANS